MSSLTLFPPRCRAALALGLFCLATSAASAQDAAKDAGDFLAALRKECLENPKLKAVLIRTDTLPDKGAPPDKGKALELKGLVDNKGQLDVIQQVAAKLLEKKEWAAALPKGVSTNSLKEFPINSKLLKMIQKDFAIDPKCETDTEKRREREILRRTRLEEATFSKDDNLVLHAICLNKDENEGKDDKVKDKKDARDIISSRFRDAFNEGELKKSYKDLLPDGLAVKDGEKVTVRLVPFDLWPMVGMQNLARSDSSLDGCLFLDNWYDDAGTLQIQGFVPLAGDIAKAGALLRRVEADPKYRDTFCVKRPASAGQLIAERPKLTIENFQGWLAAPDSVFAKEEDASLLRQTRVDRWYFSYAEKKTTLPMLNVSGICLAAQFDPKKDEILSIYLNRKCKSVYSEWHNRFGTPSVSIESIVPVVQPRFDIQELVAADPKLDGVGIADGSYFDEKGRLCLRGIWRKRAKGKTPDAWAGQEKALREVTDDFFKRKTKFSQAGVPLKSEQVELKLTELRSDEVLSAVRQWMSEKDEFEDSLIERLYFDQSGQLAILGFLGKESKISLKERNDALKGKLAELIKSHGMMNGKFSVGELTPPLTASAIRPDAPPAKTLVSFQDKDTPPTVTMRERVGLAPKLRERVQWSLNKSDPQPDSKWDGIMLRRGSYDADGNYRLIGFVDSKKQRAELAGLLGEMAQQSQWQRELKTMPNLDTMRESPTADLLDRLALVMPAYRSLDGVKVIGAVHDRDNKLVLRSRLVGRYESRDDISFGVQIESARAELQRQLMASGSEWKERAVVGVRLDELSRMRADSKAAQVLIGRAIVSLSRGLADSYPVSAGCCGVGTFEDARPSRSGHIDDAMKSLDAALMHSPDQSVGWLLRAMAYQARGDRVRSDRDLRRVAEIERGQNGREQRSLRLARTEPLQGSPRRSLGVALRRVEEDILAQQPLLQVGGPG